MKTMQVGRWLPLIGLGLSLTLTDAARAADFSEWPMKMKITFAGYNRAETLTDFPALVVLTNNLAGHFRYAEMASPANAGDLRFSAADSTTELSYEIDTWNPTGRSFIWVRVPALASSNDHIFAYWGKAGATTPPAYTTNGAAWSSGYKAVWHLGGSGSTRRDSTANGYTGTLDATGVAATDAGLIGGADLFSGTTTGAANNPPTSGGINCGNVSVTGSQTIELWMHAANLTQRRNPLHKANGGECSMTIETSGAIAYFYGTSGSDASPRQSLVTPTATAKVSEWVHLAAVRDLAEPRTLRWFVNGRQVASAAATFAAATASPNTFRIGKGYVYSFNGMLDEVRVSSVAHSSNRIWACWMNTASNAAFQTVAPAPTSLPMIDLAPATDIAADSACLNAMLIVTGAYPTAGIAYWGTQSGGVTPGNWAHEATLAAPQMPGSLSVPVAGLASNTTYYYRFAASNEAGVVWTLHTGTFITGAVELHVTAHADERTLAPGIFTISRPGTATNLPLTVTYAQTGGTAVSGVDFVPLSGTVVIPANATSATIVVTPFKHLALNADTTVELSLIGAAAVIGANATATLTITNQLVMGEVYVSANGDNTGGSSWSTAFHTLQTALNLVAPGGTIYVAGGQTFQAAAASVWSEFDAVTIRGGHEAAGGAGPGANDPVRWPTVLKPSSGALVRILTISGVAGATLENLTFREGDVRTNPAYGGAVYASAVSGLTVRNCRFVRNRLISAGNGFGGGIAALDSSGLITNSVFIGNYAATTSGTGTGSRGGALYLSGGSWILRDLQVSGSFTAAGSGGFRASNQDMAGGIFLGGAGAAFHARNLLIANCDGGGIRVDAGSATLENLTVSGNDRNGVSIAAAAVTAGTTIRNSIIYGNRDDFAGSVPTLHYNIIGDGTSAGQDGNRADDPKFAFPLFYLAATSPALNTGTGTVAMAGLTGTTVRTDGTTDSGTVSLGYHFPAGVVWDQDLYVAPGGTGNGSSAGSPLGSISAALAQAAPRTRIRIAPGTYTRTTETFPLTLQDRAVQLLGSDAASTVIDAAGSNQRVMLCTESPFVDNRIEGLTLRGGLGANGGGVNVNNATLHIRRCVVRNNQSTTNPNYGGGLYAADATLLIDQTDFLNNVAANSSSSADSQGGGVAALTAVTLRLQNGRITGNITRRSGSTTYSLYHGGGIWLGSGHFQMRNLLLADNIGGGIYVAAAGAIGNGTASAGPSVLDNLTVATNNAVGIQIHATAAPFCAIRNTIAAGNTVTNFLAATLPAVFAHTCIGGNPRTGIDGNLDADPLFIDAAGGNFRLSASSGQKSPCIDAGMNLAWMSGATDLDGSSRIFSGIVDIGAYEHVPPAGTLLVVR